MLISKSRSRGQSLVEVLVGLAIGAIFMVGAAAVVAPALQITKQTTLIQTKAELANEDVSNIRAWAAGNWNNVLALATGTANTYYLQTATSSFIAAATTGESLSVGLSNYIRYFYLSDVFRDANGNVTSTASAATYDPSTKLITVVVNASSSQASATTTISFYLTRNMSNTFNQTSWIGGSGQAVPVTSVGTNYASSSNISITASGTIQLASGGNSCTL